MNADKLEDNLNRKLDILSKILESDKRYIGKSDHLTASSVQDEEYLSEQNCYLGILEELDSEYDEILDHFEKNPDKFNSISPDKKARIRKLNELVDNKIREVNEAEAKARKYSENLLKGKRDEIAQSRKAVRVIQNNYRNNPGIVMGDSSMIDVSN